jgi:hypothetical protein
MQMELRIDIWVCGVLHQTRAVLALLVIYSGSRASTHCGTCVLDCEQ